MNRRDAIKFLSAGTAAGIGANTLTDPLLAYQGASSKGLPRLKITDVKVIQTQVEGNHLTNVKVLTSEPGLYGVGCGTHVERQLIVAETIDKFLKPLAVGRFVDEIEYIWQTTWVAPYWRASVDASNAMSAIDGACGTSWASVLACRSTTSWAEKFAKDAGCFRTPGGAAFRTLKPTSENRWKMGTSMSESIPLARAGRDAEHRRLGKVVADAGVAPLRVATDLVESAPRMARTSRVLSRLSII